MSGFWRLIVLCGMLAAGLSHAVAAPSAISRADWDAYKTRFLQPNGRIVDDSNGNISHSEGQGYGLLLSYLADSRGDFDLIWSFTRAELLVRDDGLAAWRWDPATSPHVTDINNASDGDLLMAYALALAGAAWNRPDLTFAAKDLATALGRATVTTAQGRTVIMPGASGFRASDREDGPVVNLSYWVFEAFPVMAQVVPEVDWGKLSGDGMSLVETAAIKPSALPPDWLSIRARPKAAEGFTPEFGYNALRIPLYLMRAGVQDRALLERLRDGMSADDGSVKIVSLATGAARETISDPGYRVIPALVSCVLDGTPLAEDLKMFKPTTYYPSTLHLLALSFAQRRHKECL